MDAYVIVDIYGHEIAYCEGTFNEARDLQDVVFGYDIIPLDEYEDPEVSDEE